MRVVTEWSVLADDRTGALDAAGEMARWLGPVQVATYPHRAMVVDLGSRSLTAPVAAAAVRAAAVDATRHLHKTDSMLRGNWCAELVARSDSTGRRVLMVPAWPEMHRTCRRGVVVADGVEVGRPAESLGTHGSAVSEIDAGRLQAWGAGNHRFAVCDATSEGDLHAVARWWLDHVDDVVLAGPAGVLAAAAGAFSGGCEEPATPPLPPPVMVVCASMHGTARMQLEALRRARPGVAVAASPMPPGGHAQADPAFVAGWFDSRAVVIAGTLVLIGGETAAAVMGEGRWLCSGTVAPGVAVSRRVDGTGPVYVTKAGAFGDEDTLVRVIDMVGDEADG